MGNIYLLFFARQMSSLIHSQSRVGTPGTLYISTGSSQFLHSLVMNLLDLLNGLKIPRALKP